MSARDDYPILVAWLRGMPVTGINGDGMEIAVVQALDEIDRLRAEVEGAKRISKVSDDGWCLSVRGDQRCENPIGHDGFHWSESHKTAWTDDSAPASYIWRTPRRTPA